MLTNIILYSGFSGATVFLGGLLARAFDHHVPDSPIKSEIVHALMSFGAGIMLSAIALVLLPKGMDKLSLVPIVVWFMLGTVLFYLLDKYLAKRGGKVSTLIAMLMDFIPEAIALGAVFAAEPKVAMLLAVFIGLQNLPESFNAYRELVLSGFSEVKTLVLFFALSFVGIVSALLGHFVLSDLPKITAALMVFSSGGILYLLIQDMIPESKLENNFSISLFAGMGFLLGMIGEALL